MIGSGNNCTIINRKWNEALRPGCGTDNLDRRQIFTWIPGGCGDRCNWKIEPVFTDSGLKFKLKTLFFDEYFYAAGDNLKNDEQRRNVYSRIPKSESNLWEIQSLHNGHNDGYFTIKSPKYNEYLYASVGDFNYDTNQRRIFTWQYTSEDVAVPYDDACHWAIHCD